MGSHRVFVIWNHPIFHDSMRALLNHPEVEWVGETSKLAEAEAEIQTLQPDIVLLEQVEGGPPPEFLMIFEATPWGAKIIGLSMHDNRLCIYHREQQIVGQSDDLLRLILASASPRDGERRWS